MHPAACLGGVGSRSRALKAMLASSIPCGCAASTTGGCCTTASPLAGSDRRSLAHLSEQQVMLMILSSFSLPLPHLVKTVNGSGMIAGMAHGGDRSRRRVSMSTSLQGLFLGIKGAMNTPLLLEKRLQSTAGGSAWQNTAQQHTHGCPVAAGGRPGIRISCAVTAHPHCWLLLRRGVSSTLLTSHLVSWSKHVGHSHALLLPAHGCLL